MASRYSQSKIYVLLLQTFGTYLQTLLTPLIHYSWLLTSAPRTQSFCQCSIFSSRAFLNSVKQILYSFLLVLATKSKAYQANTLPVSIIHPWPYLPFYMSILYVSSETTLAQTTIVGIPLAMVYQDFLFNLLFQLKFGLYFGSSSTSTVSVLQSQLNNCLITVKSKATGMHRTPGTVWSMTINVGRSPSPSFYCL